MVDPIVPPEAAPPDIADSSADGIDDVIPMALQNPYASPLASSRPAGRAALPKVYYPLVPRFWAANIDWLCSIILCLVVGKQLEEFGSLAQAIGVVATFFIYYFLPEALFSATLGKGLMGIMVVRRDCRRCTWPQTLVRNLTRLVEANPILSVPAGLSILLTPHKQRIGDMLAGTIVVRR